MGVVNWKELEDKAVSDLRTAIADAESHEPAIEDAVVLALGAAGAPSPVASAVGATLAALLAHFKNEQAVAQMAPAPINVTVPPPVTATTNAVAGATPTWSQVVSGQNPAS
jgi:hypothetical protein